MGQAEEGVTLRVRRPAGCLGIYRMMVVLYHLINKTMQKVKDVLTPSPPHPLSMVRGGLGCMAEPSGGLRTVQVNRDLLFPMALG